MRRRSIIYDPRLASSQKDVKITRMLLPRRKDDNINDDGEDDFADDVKNDPIIRKLTAQHDYVYVTPQQACLRRHVNLKKERDHRR
jgi:hypothetical protein